MQTVCLGNCASRHGFHCRMGVTESQCKWGDLANLLQNSTALRGSDDVFFISFNHNLQNSQIPIIFGEHEPRLFVTDLKNLHGFKKKASKRKGLSPDFQNTAWCWQLLCWKYGGGQNQGSSVYFRSWGQTQERQNSVSCVGAKGGASNKRARQESVTSRPEPRKIKKSGKLHKCTQQREKSLNLRSAA